MGHIWTVARRELAFYFNSPIAYIAIVLFLVVSGSYLFWINRFFDNDQATMRPLFEMMPVFLILYLPAISMRLVSEEKRSGTIELLATMPITDTQVIAGKYLGGLMFLGLTLAGTLVFPFVVGVAGNPDGGAIFAGYLGVFLLGAAYLAIGLMTSTWTRNQIVAFITAVVLCAFFYGIDGMVESFWQEGRDAFAFLSFKAHFDNILRGVIDTRDVLFYVSVIGVAIVVAVQSLQARNWR